MEDKVRSQFLRDTMKLYIKSSSHNILNIYIPSQWKYMYSSLLCTGSCIQNADSHVSTEYYGENNLSGLSH